MNDAEIKYVFKELDISTYVSGYHGKYLLDKGHIQDYTKIPTASYQLQWFVQYTRFNTYNGTL